MMITVTKEISLVEFEAWSGGFNVWNRLRELDLIGWAEEFLLNDTYTETEINDFLWFDVPDLYEAEFEKDLFE